MRPTDAPAAPSLALAASWPWLAAQALGFVAGLALIATLLIDPPLGVTLLWNGLIPAAPALLVVATGVWRNVCPLATAALVPDRLGLSRGHKLRPAQRGGLALAGAVALLAIVPLRHVVFNTDGRASAALLIGMGACALAAGLLFERRSGWCAGLCPVHPVEKLYGAAVAVTAPNVHCGECRRCALPCPDWTPGPTITTAPPGRASRLVEWLLAGVFPGYVWGWFLLPDDWALAGPSSVLTLYGYPLAGGLASALLYALIRHVAGPARRTLVVRTFAAITVSLYYLFRLPQLFGFNPVHNNGTLVDLTAVLPGWSMAVLNVATTLFFLYWLVGRAGVTRPWSHRPPFAAP